MGYTNETQSARGLPHCISAQMAEQVDVHLNGGAILEAEESTSVTVEIVDGDIRDDKESKYIEGEKRFRPQVRDCALCAGKVALSEDGSIESNGCVVTGSCEMVWVAAHPDQFLNEDGEMTAGGLPCEGYNCTALLALAKVGTSVAAEIVRGECTVDVEGQKYHTEGREMLNRMRPVLPEAASRRMTAWRSQRRVLRFLHARIVVVGLAGLILRDIDGSVFGERR